MPLAHPAATAADRNVIRAVASTNVYGNVIAQLGGSHVQVTSILTNPTLNPHTYQPSTVDAAAIARATLVVQNGLGYDTFMARLEAASPNPQRVVIVAGAALGFRMGANPHIWYDPTVMPGLAALVVATLSRQDPADAALFVANLRAFETSLVGTTEQRHSLGHPEKAGERVLVGGGTRCLDLGLGGSVLGAADTGIDLPLSVVDHGERDEPRGDVGRQVRLGGMDGDGSSSPMERLTCRGSGRARGQMPGMSRCRGRSNTR